MFSFAIGFSEEKDNLLTREVFLLETCFGAVKVFDRIAFLELTLERLEHDGVDLPVLVTANAIRDLGVFDTDVRNDCYRFVVGP